MPDEEKQENIEEGQTVVSVNEATEADHTQNEQSKDIQHEIDENENQDQININKDEEGEGGEDEEDGEEIFAEDGINCSLNQNIGEIILQDQKQVSAFAITMLCMSEGYESQAEEILQFMFEQFEDKDYCLITLPHDEPEPPILKHFVQLQPQSSFPEVVYIANKHVLMKNITIEARLWSHNGGIKELIQGLPVEQGILQLLDISPQNFKLFISKCEQNTIGFFALKVPFEITPTLSSAFKFPQHKILTQNDQIQNSDKDQNFIPASQLVYFVLNPLFSHLNRMILMQLIQACQTSNLIYNLSYDDANYNEIYKCFEQVIPKRNKLSQQIENIPPGAFFCLPKNKCLNNKIRRNQRIVIIGSSECGLSCLEQLICDKNLEFTNVLFISKNGLDSDGLTRFQKKDLERFSFEIQIEVMIDEVISFDKFQKVVYTVQNCDQGIPYDMLIITAGVQDQTMMKILSGTEHLGDDFHSLFQDYVMTPRELSKNFGSDDAQQASRVVIYGNTLQAYQVMRFLELKGVDIDKKVVHYDPNIMENEQVGLMRYAAEQINLNLPMAYKQKLIGLLPPENGQKMVLYFQGLDAKDPQKCQVKCDLLITTCEPEVNLELFNSVAKQNLAFDHRIIVDGTFHTSDDSILAAGTIARLSNNVSMHGYMERYDSGKVGQELAEIIKKDCQFKGQKRKEYKLPQLTKPKTITCELPGGTSFVFVAAPWLYKDLQKLQQTKEIESVQSCGSGDFMEIFLDEDRIIVGVVFCGSTIVSNATKLCGLIGLHCSYLFGDYVPTAKCPMLTQVMIEQWLHLLLTDSVLDVRQQLLLNNNQFNATLGNEIYQKLTRAIQE